MKPLLFLYSTQPNVSGLMLRLALSIVLLPHGAQMLLGWFGGYGFAGSMGYLTQTVGLPWIVGFAVIFLHFFGSLFVLLGFYSRVFAVSMIVMFLGMIVTSHWSHGFFMNWAGTQKGEGFEYHLLAVGLSIVLLIQGSGIWSIDSFLSKKATKTVATAFNYARI